MNFKNEINYKKVVSKVIKYIDSNDKEKEHVQEKYRVYQTIDITVKNIFDKEIACSKLKCVSRFYLYSNQLVKIDNDEIINFYL